MGAPDRHFEGAGKARLVRAGLAHERGHPGSELLASDGIGPPRGEGHEVLGFRLSLDEFPSGPPVAVRRNRGHLHGVGSELEQARGWDGRERPPSPRALRLDRLAAQGARELTRGFAPRHGLAIV